MLRRIVKGCHAVKPQNGLRAYGPFIFILACFSIGEMAVQPISRLLNVQLPATSSLISQARAEDEKDELKKQQKELERELGACPDRLIV
jgi:hypothetical protein